MAEIKVEGDSTTLGMRRVLLALHELELDFELVHKDFKQPKVEDPSFRLDPYGLDLVPVYKDRYVNFSRKESRVITEHIARKYCDEGNRVLDFIYSDKTIFAEAHKFELEEFSPAASSLVLEQVFKPKHLVDQTVVKEQEATLASALDHYEHLLEDSKYLACNHFSRIDLHTIPVIHYLLGTPTRKLFKRPHVRRWVDEIMSRPSSKKVLGLE